MRVRALVLGLALALSAAMPLAHAQRGGGGDSQWEFLGEQRVGFTVDKDTITINQNEAWFRTRRFKSLRFVAEGNEVHMISARLVYLNGHAEDLRIDRLIPSGGQLAVDLKGEKSYIRQIEMVYRSKPSFRGQATMKVYGEHARRPVAAPGGWEVADTEWVNRQAQSAVLKTETGERRVGQIRLRNLDEALNIEGLRIRFRNGEVQQVTLNQRLEPKALTRVIDLPGEQRRIESVTVDLKPARRPGNTRLQLLTTARAGAEGGRPGTGSPWEARGWQFLGEQTVGFIKDRDVINVAQSEEWFRQRSFRRLHFIAERNEVHMISIRLIYMNGYAQEIRVDRLIPSGADLPVDLGGGRSFIRQIEMNYRSKPSFQGQAVVKVYGETGPR